MSRSILMLEHDDDDRYITKATFEEHGYDVPLTFVSSKQDLFSFLSKAKQSNGKLPSLILLNHYPAGPERSVAIIKELKGSEDFAHIPVIMLSGTVDRSIAKECYAAGASSFIQKPSKATETDEKIASFFEYWFETVHLPA